jgi:hypothetical protein
MQTTIRKEVWQDFDQKISLEKFWKFLFLTLFKTLQPFINKFQMKNFKIFE